MSYCNRLHVRVYDVLARAVEEGIAVGWQHSYKHTNTPAEQDVRERIYDDVMVAITEVFNFDEDGGT